MFYDVVMEGLSHQTRKRLRKLSKKTKKRRSKRTNELDDFQSSTQGYPHMPVGSVFPSIGMGAVSVGGIMRHS